ncbi:hypothetical protein PtA15_8A448 [Puccinia triticina]|nr:uncharacterized protein PtA15_8A448 [Puccinia triticina]WAQ87544.1 hypothetical protein PtA15_8A448 [Puccinia triticina]
MVELKEVLKKDCCNFIEKAVGTGGTIVARRFFGENEAEAIVKNINNICDAEQMRDVIRGEAFDGQVDALMHSINHFLNNRDNQIQTDVAQSNQTLAPKNIIITQSPIEKPTQINRRKRCTPEEAEAKRLENEAKKQMRQAQILARKSADEIRKASQQQIMQEVKAQYNLPMGS